MDRPRPAEEAAWLRECLPGDYVEVDYDGDRVAHERLLLWPVEPGRWIVRSPDADEWAESLDGRDPESGPRASRPRRGGAGTRGRPPLYRFRERFEERPLRAAFLRGIRQAVDEAGGYELPEVRAVRTAGGEEVAVEECFRTTRSTMLRAVLDNSRISGAERTEAGGRLEVEEWRRFAAEDVDAAVVWLLRAPAGGLEAGESVEPSVGKDVVVGPGRALVKVGGEWSLAEAVAVAEAPGVAARVRRKRRGGGVLEDEGTPGGKSGREGSPGAERALGFGGARAPGRPARGAEEGGDDARTLWVDWDAHGERYKSWRRVCQESYAEDFGEERFEGTATALHMCKAMQRQGGDPRAWLERWLRDKHVEPTDRVAHELRALVESLYLAGSVDQLNVGSLCSVEAVCRRIAVIVEAYTVPGKPSWDHARYYSGVAAPEEVIAPGLRSYVHKRAKEDHDMSNTRIRGMPRTMGALADGTGGGGAAAGVSAAGGDDEGGRGRGAGRGRGKGGQRTPPPTAT